MSMLWRAFCLSLAAVLLSCGSDSTGPGNNTPTPASIQVNPDSALVPQLGTLQLVVSVFDEHGTRLNGVPLEITSEDTLLVRAAPTGLLTSVGPAGITGVRVQAGAASRRIGVEVKAAPAGLTLTPGQSTMLQFESVQLTATVTDKTGAPIPGATIVYRSMSPAVVAVSGLGVATSAGPAGTVQIQVQSGLLTASAQITVSPIPTGLVTSPLPMTLGAGRMGQISARVLDAVDDTIFSAVPTYSSDNPAVVTVSPSGAVSSPGPLGSARIAVEALGLADTVPVTVVANNHLQGIVDASTAYLGSPLYSVAVSRDGLVLAGGQYGTIYRSNVVDHAVTTLHPGAGEFLWALAFDSTMAAAYVAGLPAGGVSAIDTATGIVTSSVTGLSGTPLDIEVSGSAQEAFVSTTSHLYRLNTNGLTLAAAAATGAYGLHLALHPLQPLLYVTDVLGARVLEINQSSLATVRVFGGIPQVRGVGVSPDGTVLYVAGETGHLYVINLATGTRTSHALPCRPWALAVARDGTEVYLACSQESRFLVFDTALARVVTSLDVGVGPRRLALSPDGSVLVGAISSGTLVFIR